MNALADVLVEVNFRHLIENIIVGDAEVFSVGFVLVNGRAF